MLGEVDHAVIERSLAWGNGASCTANEGPVGIWCYDSTNPHSPGAIRAFAPLRNVDAWYEAFGVKEGDKSYIKPEDRVRIW